jgi:hypothetical protein
LDALCNVSSGLSIERFEFGDGVSFRLGLSVEALDSYGTDGDARNH